MSEALDEAKQSLEFIVEDYEACIQRYIDAQKNLESARSQAIKYLEDLYKRLEELTEERNGLLDTAGVRAPLKGPDATSSYYGRKWTALALRPDRFKSKQELVLETVNPEFGRIWREQQDLHARIHAGQQQFKQLIST